MEKDQFQVMIRDVLNHLSDVAYLENHNLIHPLLSAEEAGHPNQIQLLHLKIRDSIDTLRPPENIPPDAPEWRCYRILSMRYLHNMDLYRVGEEVGLSQRQVYRELNKGLEAIISILWKQQQALTAAYEGKKEIEDEISDSVDLAVLQDQLKQWEVNYTFNNLFQMISQAYQLCERFIHGALLEQVHHEQVDHHVRVRVDKTLTQQGIYKILTTVEKIMQTSEIWLRTRKLNDHFVELVIRIKHIQALDLPNWQIAQLFFIIQGFNHSLREQEGETVFAITLPLMSQSKILVIDDIGPERTLIERMLGPYGIQVFGTGSPQKALSLAQLLKPNFILLDVLMPKIDGWQVLKMLKTDPETNHIPVYICSVLNEGALALSLGAAGLIRKPINRLDLIETLSQASLIETNQVS